MKKIILILISLFIGLYAFSFWPGSSYHTGMFWKSKQVIEDFPVDTNSLILYLKFDEDDLPVDYSVNAFIPQKFQRYGSPFYTNNGFMGGCWVQTNLYGWVNFTNSHYFNNYRSNITISAWVYIFTNTGTDNNRMFERRGPSGPYHFSTMYDRDRVVCGTRMDNSRYIDYNQNLLSNWHHIVGVRYTDYVFYVDGVAVATNSGAPSYATALSHLTLFNACTTELGTNVGMGSYFMMDEFMWFATNLTPDEIKQIYDWGVANKN